MILAYEKGLDLVQVAANNDFATCKLMDYQKTLYHQEKQLRKQRASHKGGEVKEVRLSLQISQHDFGVKAERAKKFFNEGNKVRAFLILKGREIRFKDRAYELIEKLKETIGGEFESPVKKEGKTFWALLRKK